MINVYVELNYQVITLTRNRFIIFIFLYNFLESIMQKAVYQFGQI